MPRAALTNILTNVQSGANPKTVERWQEGSAEPNEAAWRNLEKLETLCQLSFRLLRESSLKPWFNAPNESLGGEKPMETLGRGEIDRVKNVLGMLEWGIYS